MSTYTTSRRISLASLAFPASMVGRDGTYTVTADQPEATLQAAVDAAPTDNTEANGGTLRTQAETALTGHRTFLAIASPTNAQVAAQVKALTRSDLALIRLALGKLDATD